MVTVGVVFEHPDFNFSGKDHIATFLTEPLFDDEITFVIPEHEMDEDFAKDLSLFNGDLFRVIRRSHVSGKHPRLLVFLSPIQY
ncbi:MAG: hypothetical protein AAF039_09780 [Bacteroidota bacterium]|uniref:hypothetical protein n=1 Tax=Flagellimonas flava TaxID=570519 RepID=UPI0032389F87